MKRGARGTVDELANDYLPPRLRPREGWMPTRILIVPQSIWDDTWRAFAPYAQRGLECPAFWHGIENDATGVDVVTTLTLPHAHRTGGYYNVPQEETRRVSQAVEMAGVVALAQVHTHPGDYIQHSEYDDQNALSMGETFLSLIFPFYGEKPLGIERVGVHERCDHRWFHLTAEQRARRIRIVPILIDLRR